ncbi:hypothetical protein BGZ97_005616 [Linnemannia gamsii]|jgi:hypothetical protein|uniref:Uncharacterized protein n=1 Tax=Linnemannia gamsii TaxID=64522 RepID=A0A9P6QUA3_9FUNG|nr:hypothetical protein BGZ97_005616 [Linnemannia gamsii]
MPLNPFATGAAVIAGAIAGPLMVTNIAGVLVAAGPATLVVTSVAGPVAGVASLSALQTAIATAFGGMAAGVFSVITRGDDDRRHSRASYTESIDRGEGCIGGDDHQATQNTDVKEAVLVVGSKRLE